MSNTGTPAHGPGVGPWDGEVSCGFRGPAVGRGPVGPGMTGLSLKRAVLQIRGSGLRAWDVGFGL